MCERTEPLEPGGCRATNKLVNDVVAHPECPRVVAHDKRADLTDARAEGGQFGAGDHASTPGSERETLCVNGNFSPLTREQVPILEMTDDERMNGACIGWRGNAEADVLKDRWLRLRPWYDTCNGRRRPHARVSVSAAEKMLSSMSTARSMSAASMLSAGKRRTTFSSVLITSKPRSRAASTTPAASTRN